MVAGRDWNYAAMTIKAATLFSGIGAPEVSMPGWTWLWHAEVEKFPCAVMKARHPESVNLGDVNAEDFVERALAAGRPDAIVFGSPCQSFSVAGKRLGLDDPRGNLTLIGIGLVAKIKPKYAVWENVPGVLSDEDGETIQTVVELFTQIGYVCDINIWDAQYAGVPQRRRRVWISCARLEDLLQTRTPISERITADLLAQALLATWDALLAASSPAKLRSASEQKIEPFGSSPSGKMRLLDALSGGSAVTRLLDFWADQVALSTEGPTRSDSTSPRSSAKRSQSSGTGTDGFRSSDRTANDAGGKNIASSPRKNWADLWDRLSASTTSTSAPPTTDEEICTFAETTLTIVRSTIGSSTSSLNQQWSSDYWSLAFFALTIAKEIIAYAGSASCELFSTSELRARWWNNLDTARRYHIELEQHLGDWGSAEEILSLSESLRGDFAPRREAGERAAGTVTSRVGNGSRQAGGNGNLAGQTEFLPQSSRVYDEEGVAPTVQTTGKRGGHRPPMIAASTSGDGYWREGIGPLRGREQDSHENLVAGTLNANKKAAGSATQQDAENGLLIAGTLDAASGKSRGAGTPPGMLMPTPILEASARTGREGHEGRDGLGLGEPGDPMFALQAKQRHAVAFGGNNTSGELDVSTAVRAKGGTGHGDFESETFVMQTRGSDVGVEDDQTGTLGSNADRASGSAPMVLAFDPRQISHPANHSNPKPGDPCHPLRGVANAEPAIIAFDTMQITHPENRSRPDDRSPQLSQSGHPPAVAFSQRTRGDDGRGYEREPRFVEEVSPTIEAIKPPGIVTFDCKAGGDTSFSISDQTAGSLRGEGHGGGHAAVAFKPSHYTRDKDSGPSEVMAPLTADADKGDQDPVLFTGAAVRRLTPMECERLMGLPDGYTLINFRGKPAADGPRYRCLGNSLVVNEVRWILSRIEMFEGLK